MPHLMRRRARLAAGAAVAVTGAVTTVWSASAVTPCSPLAVDDVYATTVDTPFGVGAPGASGNDVETCGLPATWGPVSTGGSFAGNGDGSFSFQPDAGYTGDFYTSYYYGAQTEDASAEVRIIINGPLPETTEPPPESTDPAPETTDPAPETTAPPPESTGPVTETTDPAPEPTDPEPQSTDPPSTAPILPMTR